MAVTANFYYTTDDPRTIGKKLRAVASAVQCKVYETTTITEPRLILNYDAEIFQANYCYLGYPYNRYYFMSPPATLPGGRMGIPLTVDVLESFKEGICRTEAFILRAESDCDNLIVDDLIPARAGVVNSWETSDELFVPFEYAFPPEPSKVRSIVIEIIGE